MWQKRPTWIVVLIVVGVWVGFLLLPERASLRVKSILGGIFLPLFGISDGVRSAEGTLLFSGLSRGDLLKKVDELERQNQLLRLRLDENEEISKENERLRETLGWANRQRWKLKLARVVGHDPSNWWQSVFVNVGERDGIREGMPVVTPEGLVGKVGMVGAAQSRVILLGDPSCQVSARVQETRDIGVIRPSAQGLLAPGLVYLTFLNLDGFPRLKTGQLVVTSGLGPAFREGIVIGTLIGKEELKDRMYGEALVKLNVNFGQLEEVWVLQD